MTEKEMAHVANKLPQQTALKWVLREEIEDTVNILVARVMSRQCVTRDEAANAIISALEIHIHIAKQRNPHMFKRSRK